MQWCIDGVYIAYFIAWFCAFITRHTNMQVILHLVCLFHDLIPMSSRENTRTSTHILGHILNWLVEPDTCQSIPSVTHVSQAQPDTCQSIPNVSHVSQCPAWHMSVNTQRDTCQSIPNVTHVNQCPAWHMLVNTQRDTCQSMRKNRSQVASLN